MMSQEVMTSVPVWSGDMNVQRPVSPCRPPGILSASVCATFLRCSCSVTPDTLDQTPSKTVNNLPLPPNDDGPPHSKETLLVSPPARPLTYLANFYAPESEQEKPLKESIQHLEKKNKKNFMCIRETKFRKEEKKKSELIFRGI